MKIRVFKNLAKVAFAAALLLSLNVHGQWSGAYGNEWLDGKYGQTWLRIGVTVKGVQKVTLPDAFKNKVGQLHLYRRGVEVALISASTTEIEFYGVLNDGASDALLYRPYTGVRVNPYYSWFSDESAYFLTFDSSTPTKMAEQQATLSTGVDIEPYHLQKDLTVYSNSDTYDGSQNIVTHSLDNSYFIEGKGRSGIAYFKGLLNGNNFGNPIYGFPFKLENLIDDPSKQPEIEFLLNGRSFAANQIRASVGPTSGSLTDFSDFIEFSDFIPYKVTLPITTSKVDGSGNGYFQLESLKTVGDLKVVGAFSVTYLLLRYPQSFAMLTNSKTFNLLPTANTESKINITGVPNDARVFDITDIANPRIIPNSLAAGTLSAVVDRSSTAVLDAMPTKPELNLLVTSATVTNTNLTDVTFTSYDPSGKDYLMITTETLISAATDYETYRKSAAGGSHRTLLVKIKDIYNQFNYGEPSPVAIRRFVDFMLKDGIRIADHNLLLIGPTTTFWKGAVRELSEEVPAIGFPGSDLLLVEGLAGTHAEVQAIPIGRIVATTTTQVTNYLNKVKYYEGTQPDPSWRRQVMHISGGLATGESATFAGYLSMYNSLVLNAPFSGAVTPKVKDPNDTGYPNASLDIAPNLTSGVGFMAYFGHGSSHYTDNNIGYVSDPTRNYPSNGKYPIMYFNGCGVSNIFNGAFGAFPTTPVTNQMPISMDWLVTADKGAVAIIGNTYYAFAESSDKYIGALYQGLFKADNARRTIGRLQRDASLLIMTGLEGARLSDDPLVTANDINNTHQSLLLGDPALRVLVVKDPPLPVELVYFQAKAESISKVKLEWKTTWEKNNSYFLLERSADAKTFQTIGTIDGKGDTNSESLYSFIDSNPNAGNNYYRLAQVDRSASVSEEGKKTLSRIVNVNLGESDALVLMPNPTSDLVKIQLANNIEISSARLIRTNGQEINLGKITGDINLKNYPTGQYLLEVKTSAGDVYRKKIVKN
jgi:hypothetical protein